MAKKKIVLPEIWQTSNKQPWVEALLTGVTVFKTRSLGIYVPPEGTIVLLHASTSLYPGWKNYKWTDNMDVQNLKRGGIVGIAILGKHVMASPRTMGKSWRAFKTRDGQGRPNYLAIEFQHIRRTPFIQCKGKQVPFHRADKEVVRRLNYTLRKYIIDLLHEYVLAKLLPKRKGEKAVKKFLAV